MPIEVYRMRIYLNSLVLSHHWGFELGTRGSRVWIQTRISGGLRRGRTGVDRFDLKMFVAGVNSGTKSLLSRN
jgi:hypothetical protein